MGTLDTNFGRHPEEIRSMEAFLMESDIPQLNALVVGGGFDTLLYYPRIKEDEEVSRHPSLLESYSWEYLDVAAMLVRIGKPWTLTVVDNDYSVGQAVRNQTQVVIDDFCDEQDAVIRRDYAVKFLETFGIKEYGDGAETVNSALEACGLKERVSIVYTLDIHEDVRKRITFVHGNIQDLSELELPHEQFDVITSLSVSQYLNDYQEARAKEGLVRKLGENGILATDFHIPELSKVGGPNSTYQNYDAEGVEVSIKKVTHLLSKNPEKPKVVVAGN